MAYQPTVSEIDTGRAIIALVELRGLCWWPGPMFEAATGRDRQSLRQIGDRINRTIQELGALR